VQLGTIALDVYLGVLKGGQIKVQEVGNVSIISIVIITHVDDAVEASSSHHGTLTPLEGAGVGDLAALAAIPKVPRRDASAEFIIGTPQSPEILQGQCVGLFPRIALQVQRFSVDVPTRGTAIATVRRQSRFAEHPILRHHGEWFDDRSVRRSDRGDRFVLWKLGGKRYLLRNRA
jgi:hypothetical protein